MKEIGEWKNGILQASDKENEGEIQISAVKQI